MVRWSSIALLAALLVACGGEDDALPQDGQARSGTRLRVVQLVDDAGATVPAGWFDRSLGVPCAWTQGSEPVCLPEALLVSIFEDAGCERPLARPWSGGLPHRFQVAAVGTFGAMPESLWALSDEPWTAATAFRIDVDGACVAADVDGPLVRVDHQIDLAELARGHLATVGNGRLRTVVVVGDDGSQAPVTPFDTVFGVPCHVEGTSTSCAPEATEYTGFEDPGCTRPIVVLDDPASPPPVMIAASDVGGGRARYFPAIAPEEGQGQLLTLFEPRSNSHGRWTCQARPRLLEPGQRLVRARAGISVTPVAVTPVVRRGARLDVTMASVPGFHVLARIDDRVLGRTCTPYELSPDDWRCVPGWTYTARLFRDPACTDAGWFAVYATDDLADPVAIAVDDDVRGLETWRAFQVGPVVTPVFGRLGTTCIKIRPFPVFAVNTVRELGPELPHRTLARLTRVIE